MPLKAEVIQVAGDTAMGHDKSVALPET